MFATLVWRTADPMVLECAAPHGLVLLTHDRKTIPPSTIVEIR